MNKLHSPFFGATTDRKGRGKDTAEWLVVGVLLRVIREEHGLVCGDTWSNDPSTSNVAYLGISTESRLKWPFSSGKKASLLF